MTDPKVFLAVPQEADCLRVSGTTCPAVHDDLEDLPGPRGGDGDADGSADYRPAERNAPFDKLNTECDTVLLVVGARSECSEVISRAYRLRSSLRSLPGSRTLR